jgi:hypothetical protein
MARQCTFWTEDGRCLGHPAVDDEAFPPVCPRHIEVLAPLIRFQARMMNPAEARRGPHGPTAPRRRAVPRIRPDAHLNDDDARVLAFLARTA